MSQISPKPVRQPQMDGLRAFALLFVLIHHFGGPFLNHLNLGSLGVRFFFVVSGFLITRILLKSRQKLEASQTNWRAELSTFHIRRLLRTVPAYYLSLLTAAALAIPPVRESLAWTLTFFTNFYIAKIGYFPATISHFWTLAVQEQFYFFWPFLIFFLPLRWIKWSFPALVVASLVFRYYCIATDASYVVRWFNVLNSLDSFAGGGLLAYASQTYPKLISEKSTRIWSGWLAFLSLGLALWLRSVPPNQTLSIFQEFFEMLAMTWLIACSVTGFSGWLGKLFSWRPLTYLGQISYGVYVYHVLISILLLPIFIQCAAAGNDPQSIALRFFIQSSISIGLASLSWHFFEKPMLTARERLGQWLSPTKPT